MSEREELQRLANIVESQRTRLQNKQMEIENLDHLVNEHLATIEVLDQLLTAKSTSGKASAKIAIGSGVSIAVDYTEEDAVEGKTLVDYGSEIFGELSWSDAKALTIERLDAIRQLRSRMLEQAAEMEQQIAKAANAFNDHANALQAAAGLTDADIPMPKSTQSLPSQSKTTSSQGSDKESGQPSSETTSNSQNEPKRERRRRFGSELTLDD